MSGPERRAPALDPCPAQLPGDGRLILAFSGGADSTALASLIAASGQAREVLCVHVDHGLDAGSGERAAAARSIASRLALPFCLETANIRARSNQEAAARRARYAALKRHVEPGDCLLTAHHADDQVETIILRLLRGAGPGGLAGIPRQRRFGSGWLARPLLDWTRAELQNHCREARIGWIEDPSNRSQHADRNFLRHHVLPQLRGRWPGLDQSVLRSGRLSGQAAKSIEARLIPLLTSALKGPDWLDALPLEGLSDLELSEALRIWSRNSIGDAPPGRPLDEFLRQVRRADGDQVPELRWKTGVIRYWHRQFWIDGNDPLPEYDLFWRIDSDLALPGRLGTLRVDGSAGVPSAEFRVRSGRDGERMRLSVNGKTQQVKELLRTHGVPPWQRASWPRICDDDRLLAVGDRWIDHEFAAWLENHRLVLRWHALNSRAD